VMDDTTPETRSFRLADGVSLEVWRNERAHKYPYGGQVTFWGVDHILGFPGGRNRAVTLREVEDAARKLLQEIRTDADRSGQALSVGSLSQVLGWEPKIKPELVSFPDIPKSF